MPDMTNASSVSPDDLPHVKRLDLLRRYKDRLEGSLALRKSEGYDDTWDRMRDLYRLRAFDNWDDDDRVLVAIAFATINVIEPSVSINYPYITINATREEFADQATIAEAAMNYNWRHHDYQPEVRLAVKDWLVFGHGWLKVGYRYEEVDEDRPEADVNAEGQQQIRQVDSYAAAYPHLAGDLPSDNDIWDAVPRTTPKTLHDEPFVVRVAPEDMAVDAEATTERNMNWIAQRVVRSLESAKADKRYKKSVRDKLEGSSVGTWSTKVAAQRSAYDYERVVLWEFYDLERNTMCVFADNMDDNFLIDPEPIPYSYGNPFIMIRDYDVPDQFYPIGELEALEPLQNELNDTRSAMVRARKQDIRKYLVREEMLTDRTISDLRSDKDNTLIVVKAGSTQLSDLMAPVPANGMVRPELYDHSKVILDDFDRISAVSDYQRGELPEVRRTATEANIVENASNARASDKLATVERVMGQVARRLLQLMQQYMDQEQSARITGTDGKNMWFQYKPSDIQGEFDFDVEAGSTQPKNEQLRRQQAMQLPQVLEGFMSAGIIDPRMIAMKMLKDGFDIRNPEKYILPPQQGPNPAVKMIETMAYKDTPPDIQRQIESAAGFQPSQYGSLPVDAVVDAHAQARDNAQSEKETAQQQEHASGEAEKDRKVAAKKPAPKAGK